MRHAMPYVMRGGGAAMRTRPAALRRLTPSPADRAFGDRDGRPLRWPVSGLTASCRSPSHLREAGSGIGRHARKRVRWPLTVAGTAQVERFATLPVSRLTAHANARASTKRAHTIAQAFTAGAFLTSTAGGPTLARTLVLARTPPVRAVKRETGRPVCMDRANLCCPRNGKRRHREKAMQSRLQCVRIMCTRIYPLRDMSNAREGEAAFSPARIPARKYQVGAAGMRRIVHEPIEYPVATKTPLIIPAFRPATFDHASHPGVRMQTRKIPVTIVTGFLGSGKTTLLRHILQHAGGLRVAVIVNEFGELGIDGEILKGCGIGCDDNGNEVEGQLYELANGCLCCTVQEEFFPVMEKLVERRDQIDHVLIETSGLALPKPLVQAFNWPQIKNSFTVDAVVTVVDGPAAASGQFAENPQAFDAQRKADPNL